MENNKTTKTALGISENIAGLLCYALGFITGEPGDLPSGPVAIDAKRIPIW